MILTLDPTITQNFEEALAREWLETNGLGGWAGSTVIGAHTRRYHGLLVAATRPPVQRMVLLSKLDEAIVTDKERYELGCNCYPGAVHPRGYQYLHGFSKDLFPHFHYEAGGIHIEKTVAAVHGENTTLVLYEVHEAPSPFVLDLRPFVAGRDYHGLMHANDAMRRDAVFRDDIFRVQPYYGVPEIFISIPGATFHPWPEWYCNFEYRIEGDRGFDCHEDLFCHGTFTVKLDKGGKLAVIVSTDDPSGRDAFELFEGEQLRRRKLIETPAARDDFSTTLTLAADQFVVQRGEDLRTIIAGYHWFTDWGRDTMIALPGIMLATGRHDDARKVLRAFAAHVSEGMLPNRFPDGDEAPDYNTVDATLWFFVAIYRYFTSTGDGAFIRDELLGVLREIILWHDRGTRYGIRVDTDGLLTAGAGDTQLTWMDARIGHWVVTPRQGKAVEINALWYNALKIMARLVADLDESCVASVFERRAAMVKHRFNEVFWYEQGGYLYDYIDGDYKDTAVRPNQIFSVSLPFQILPDERARSVLTVVEETLLTPRGLRTLDPAHPDYRPHYQGNSTSRDSAYHQGTVWPWLLGPFVTALVRTRGREGKEQAESILENMAGHFRDGGIGTVSEIFDGAAPHVPRGCIAQAWSVSEILRAYLEDVIADN